MFVPIRLEAFARGFVKLNRGESLKDVTAHLRATLEAYKAGARCHCGEPIWVVGSSVVGHGCFTCITGEAYPSEDYEIDEACGKHRVRSVRPTEKRLQGGGWREAKKLCRLNQSDIEMAKRLGFQPDSLVRAIPGSKDNWKQPVKYWIRDLHLKRFGHVLRAEAPPPAPVKHDDKAARAAAPNSGIEDDNFLSDVGNDDAPY